MILWWGEAEQTTLIEHGRPEVQNEVAITHKPGYGHLAAIYGTREQMLRLAYRIVRKWGKHMPDRAIAEMRAELDRIQNYEC